MENNSSDNIRNAKKYRIRLRSTIIYNNKDKQKKRTEERKNVYSVHTYIFVYIYTHTYKHRDKQIGFIGTIVNRVIARYSMVAWKMY